MELAKYVLRDQPRWTPEAIETAMHGGTETHVKLREPIPIHILYLTSWVDPKGGLHFRDDVYGYDAKQATLTTSTKARPPSPRLRRDTNATFKEGARRPRPEASVRPLAARPPASGG
jgi:hypothetical protein